MCTCWGCLVGPNPYAHGTRAHVAWRAAQQCGARAAALHAAGLTAATAAAWLGAVRASGAWQARARRYGVVYGGAPMRHRYRRTAKA